MFKESRATSISTYLALVPDERKEMVNTLHNFIHKAAPNLRVYFAHNMLGYGSFPYTNYKKEKLNWPIIALANQKNYVSIYICAIEGGEYIAEKYKEKFGKVSVGKSCIRFRKLEDINLPALKMIIQKAAKNPGLISK
ncbi:DUF1801 domain-containing protein [Candidatus Woesebacteria bacterium]|nr:MAG: DUF1801 domain-containing protein [Candidatus Woesebacteria bacterium]